MSAAIGYGLGKSLAQRLSRNLSDTQSGTSNPSQLALIGKNIYGTNLGNIQVLASGEPYGTYRQPRQARMYRFDGTDDYCLRASSLSLTDFTFACWIEPESTTNCNIFGNSTNSDYIRFSTNGATLVVRSNNANTTIGLSDFFWLNEVAHIAVTRSGSTVTVYKNGTQVGQVTHNATAFGFSRVGTWSGSTQFYKGKMAALKVYTVAKTANEIAAIATELGTLSDTNNLSAYYPMIEESGTTCYDAFGNNDLTITNADTTLGGTFHATSSQLRFNPANLVGYTLIGNVVIPRNEATPIQDAAGNALGVTGVAPNPITINVPCLTMDGVDDYVAISDLAGSETVISLGGTSTLSVAAGRVNFTAGTCFGFSLSSGHYFPCQEGAGATLWNTGTGVDGTITNANTTKQLGCWISSTTAIQSWRVKYGGRIGLNNEFVPCLTTGSTCADDNARTLAPGKVCVDGGLTSVNFNPFSKAENNRLELPTIWDEGSDVLSQIVPFNTKFARIKNDGVDRLASYFSAVTPSTSYFELPFIQSRINLPINFNNWNLCEIYTRASTYFVNTTAARLLPVYDQTFYVATTGNDSNNGLSIGTAKLTIASALAAATGVPRVLVSAGTYAAVVTKQCLIEGNGAVPTITGCSTTSIYTGWKNCRFTSVLSNSAGLMIVESCAFASSGSDAMQTSNGGKSYVFSATADGCAADVFNYVGSTQGLEVDCETGVITPNGSVTGNNASTGHASSRIVRVKGTYKNSPNVIHDVNLTRSILFDCTVGGGTSFNLGAGSTSIASEDVHIWVYGGDLKEGATHDIETDTDGTIYIDNKVDYESSTPGSNIETF